MLFSCVKILEKVNSHSAITSCFSYASHVLSNLLHAAITLQMNTNHEPTIILVTDHFTVMYLVAWPLNENNAGGDLVLIETSLLFLCQFLLISMRTASLT